MFIFSKKFHKKFIWSVNKNISDSDISEICAIWKDKYVYYYKIIYIYI